MKSTFVLSAVIHLVIAAYAPSVAYAAGAAEASATPADVYTRAIVRSISKNDQKHLYIRLKLLPGAKLPFSTLTYRVIDERLVAGLREGDSVAFKAERVDGENVLKAIQAATPCERFRECK
ncbi:hypothetical protein HK414_23480 [Ramlibacter terrae]|uniref:Copper-binding protein n=1 Tax=Ramlibacter terrae TaxID=2732511 RepID=A0ABX6P835_9BURK|nr:hypothetical protein HK414_23480 [Ramlibacter terrae]